MSLPSVSPAPEALAVNKTIVLWRWAWAVVAASVVVLFVRRPDAFYRPQFWAEDFIFLALAEGQGLHAFVLPQAGYLHLIPRLAAWCAIPLDPALQPAFFMAVWLALFVTVALTCLSPRLELPAKPWLAVVMLLVPNVGEVFFTLTNAQWIAALGLLLTVLKRDPRTVSDWAVDLAFVLGSGLSGPFALFASPLLAWRWMRRRTRASGILLLIAAATAAIQGWFILHGEPDHEFTGPFRAGALFATISFRLVANVFAGTFVGEGAGAFFLLAIGAAILALLVAAARRSPYRAALGTMAVFGLLLLTATAIYKRIDLWGLSQVGDRYFFVPKVLLLWCAIIAMASDSRPWRRYVVGVLLVGGALANAPRFRFPTYREYPWYELCPDIRAGRAVEVTVNPGWKFRYVRGHPEETHPIK